MDQQQHMTKTEAHPYHHGRGMKVYDPNCPLCREGHEPERGTYVSWSLYEKVMQESEQRREACERYRGEVATLTARNTALEAEVERMRQYNQAKGWHEKCHIITDHTEQDEDGVITWWTVRSPDQQHYLDENDGQWKECPQMMGGWYGSEQSARTALHKAPCPPGIEPTDGDWKRAGEPPGYNPWQG